MTEKTARKKRTRKTARKPSTAEFKRQIAAQKAKNEALERQLAEAQEKLNYSTDAIHHPVDLHKERMEPMEVENIGQPQVREMESTGDAKYALSRPEIEVIESVLGSDKANNLIFMEDMLEVTILEDNDPNADPIPYVINGGRNQYFLRGQRMKVRRKFVEILARSKRSYYSNKKVTDNEGNDKYIYPERVVPRYPFNVDFDPAGQKGRDWLTQIMKER